MRVLIPAAGRGQRFRDQFAAPKPFIEIEGRYMIDHVIDMFKYDHIVPPQIEVALQENCHLAGIQHLEHERGCTILPLGSVTRGTAETVLMMLDHIMPGATEPIMVVNCDNYTTYPMQLFADTCQFAGVDAGVITFPCDNEARYSYAKGFPYVKEVKEKVAISDTAIAGFFWFRNAKVLYDALDQLFATKDTYNGEYYLAPALNYVDGGVLNVLVPRSEVYTWGTPEELHNWFEQGKTLRKD